jgi:hypothetical protein
MCQHREEGNIPDGFFLLKKEGILEHFLEWSALRGRGERGRRHSAWNLSTDERWNGGINLPQNVSAQRETEEAAGDRQANFFLHDWFFFGFLTTDVGSGVGSSVKLRGSSELGCCFFFRSINKNISRK